METMDISIDDYSLGERIRHFRKLRNFKQADLASRCGITQGGLSSMEKNAIKPSLRTLEAIAKVVQVEPAVFFGKENVVILDIKKLRAKYKRWSQLPRSLQRQLKLVESYLNSIGRD